MLRWSTANNPTNPQNRFFPGQEGKIQLREPPDFIYFLSQDLSALRLTHVENLQTPQQFLNSSYHSALPKLKNVRDPLLRASFPPPEYPSSFHFSKELADQHLKERNNHLKLIESTLNKPSLLNHSTPEFRTNNFREDHQIFVEGDEEEQVPVFAPLHPRDKSSGSLREQMESGPTAHSDGTEQGINLEETFSSTVSTQVSQDTDNLAAASIPEVNMNNSVIMTKRQRLASELPYNQPFGEFLIQYQAHVNTFEKPITSLYLEPVLMLDRMSNKYELDLHKCTQSTYTTIKKLLSHHEKYNLFQMNSASLANFYEKFMGRYKTTPLPSKVKQPKSKKKVQIAEEEEIQDAVTRPENDTVAEATVPTTPQAVATPETPQTSQTSDKET